jgi:hypothetical protein
MHALFELPLVRTFRFMLEAGSKARFTRRLNADGTFDSVCLRCYRAAGHAERSRDLAAVERSHDCHLSDLLHLTPFFERKSEIDG